MKFSYEDEDERTRSWLNEQEDQYDSISSFDPKKIIWVYKVEGEDRYVQMSAIVWRIDVNREEGETSVTALVKKRRS